MMLFLLSSILLKQPILFQNCNVQLSKTLYSLKAIENQKYQNIFLSLCSNFNLSEFHFIYGCHKPINKTLVAIYCRKPKEKSRCVPLLYADSLDFQFTTHLEINAKSDAMKRIGIYPISFNLKVSLYPDNIPKSSSYKLTFDNHFINLTITDHSLSKLNVSNINDGVQFPYEIQSSFTTRNFLNDDYILRTDLKKLNINNSYGSMYQIDNDTMIVFQPVGFLRCPHGFTCDESIASSWLCFSSNDTCNQLGLVNQFPIIKYPKGATQNGLIQIVHSDHFVLNIACNYESTSNDVDWTHFIYDNQSKMIGIYGESSLICPTYNPISISYHDCIFCGAQDHCENYIFDTYKMNSDSINGYSHSFNYSGNLYTLQGSPCRYSKCPNYDNGTCFGDEDCKFWFCSNETSDSNVYSQCLCFGSSLSNSTFDEFIDDKDPSQGFKISYPNRFGQTLTIQYSYDNSSETKFDIETLHSITGLLTENKVIEPLHMGAVIQVNSYYAKNDTFKIPIPIPGQIFIQNESPMQDFVFIDKGSTYYAFQSSSLADTTIFNFTTIPYHKCYKSTVKVAISIYNVIGCPFSDYQYPNDQLNEANIWVCWETGNGTKYCHPTGSKYIGFDIISDEDEIVFKYQGLYQTSAILHLKCQRDLDKNDGFLQTFEMELDELTGEQKYHFYLENSNLCLKEFKRLPIPEVKPTPLPQNTQVELTAHQQLNDSVIITANLNEIKPFSEETFYVSNNDGYEKVAISMSINTLLSCPSNSDCLDFKWANIWKTNNHISIPIGDYRYGVNVTFEKVRQVRKIRTKTVRSSERLMGSTMNSITKQNENEYDVYAVFGGGINGAVTKIDFICDYDVENVQFDQIVYQSSNQNEYYFTAYSQYACPQTVYNYSPSRPTKVYQRNENEAGNPPTISSTAIALIIVGGVIVLASATAAIFHFVTKKAIPTSIDDTTEMNAEERCGEENATEGDEENPQTNQPETTQNSLSI